MFPPPIRQEDSESDNAACQSESGGNVARLGDHVAGDVATC